jgi:hypothetical protein
VERRGGKIFSNQQMGMCLHEGLHETNIDSGVRVVNFSTSENSFLRSTVFSHHKIHKYSWNTADDTSDSASLDGR